MGERYWAKPSVQIRVFGDTVLAQTHIKRARVYAGLLMSQTSKLRPMRFHQWEEPDGTTIWVQVWNDLLGQRAILEITSGSTKAQILFGFYLESDFIEPSQVLPTYLTFGSQTVRDVKDAVLWHGDRSESWSNKDPEAIGFYNHPTGTELVVMTQPLSLGYGKPTASLSYTEARLRYEKCTAYFGNQTTYDDRLTQGLGSGTSTGKMVLYHRAKLGAKLDSVTADLETQETLDLATAVARYQQERFVNMPSPVGLKRGWHTCYGLHTDANGDYWIVHIAESTTVTCTKLFVWPAYRRAVADLARNTNERLFAEAYALGYSQLTDTVVTCTVSHDCPHTIYEYAPIAYAWHFNWDGSQAILVGHRMAGSEETNRLDKHHLDTRVMRMALNITQDAEGNYEATASVTTEETAQWQRITDYQSDVMWLPSRAGNGVVNMTLYSPTYYSSAARYEQPEQVPVYAYFYSADGRHENNDVFLVRYTRVREVVEEIEDCFHARFGYYFCAGEPHTGEGERTAGVRQKIGYYTPVESLELESDYSVYGRRWAEIHNTGDTNVISEIRGGSSVAVADANMGSCGCAAATIHQFSASQGMPGDYWVNFSMTTHFWQPTLIEHNYQQSYGIPAIGLVIPADCAEGVLLSGRWQKSASYQVTTKVDSPTASRKFVETSDFVAVPSGTVLSGGSYITDYGEASFSTSVESTAEYELFGRVMAFGKYGKLVDEEDQQTSDTGFPELTVAEHGYAEISLSNDMTGWVLADAPGLYMPQAFGGAVFIRGTQKRAYNGFPEIFETLDYPPEIIGSI